MASKQLELSRVTLYKNNLAFTQREGELSENFTDFELRVPAARRQLVVSGMISALFLQGDRHKAASRS